MLEQGRGVFINITRYFLQGAAVIAVTKHFSSTGYTRPRPGFAIYNASKAAVTVYIYFIEQIDFEAKHFEGIHQNTSTRIRTNNQIQLHCPCGWKYFNVGQTLILTQSLLLTTARLKSSIGDDADSDQKLQGVVESIPMKRVTQPQDVANAAWYLGSDESSFVTGTTLEVDGGRGV